MTNSIMDVEINLDSTDNILEKDQLQLRALVSTKEAGVIIGKGGKNVADLRQETGVKAGISKVVQGIHDRVLTVSGNLEGVVKAYSSIATIISENQLNNNSNSNVIILRLLISHNLMGTIIGRQGAKIKHIQDISGVRMTASKTILPQSTERVVELRGTVEAIQKSISEIAAYLIEDKDRAHGTILYNPIKITNIAPELIPMVNQNRNTSNKKPTNENDPLNEQQTLNKPELRTQYISIPSDMVGCIIGKGGSKISEIRKLSGSHISIAKLPHDETGERMFTIQGTFESNEKALYLLYGQLEIEKERRLSMQNSSQLI